MIYAFKDFELDESLFELRKSERRVNVQPKVLLLILCLVKRRDRVVVTSELFECLWPRQVVGKTSLTKAVRSARRVLGDTGASQGAVRTVHRLGYRFALPVRECGRPMDHGQTCGTRPLSPIAEASEAHGALGSLEGLSAACRGTLRAAALIGYEFPKNLLSEVMRMSEVDLTPLLEEAIFADLIHPCLDANDRYVFAHARTRDQLHVQGASADRSPNGHQRVSVTPDRNT